MKLYHGTSEQSLELECGVLDFCTTEEFAAAEEYATDLGDDGFVHEYVFSGEIMSEDELFELLEEDEGSVRAYDLLDLSWARAKVAAAGYVAVEFSDTTNGGRPITTVRVLNAAALRLEKTHSVEF